MKTRQDMTFDCLPSSLVDQILASPTQELDAIIEAIHAAKLEKMASRLREAGFRARASAHSRAANHTFHFRYIAISNPDADATPDRAYADLDEARRLLDTARNLPPTEAFARWLPKTDQEFEIEPYTEDDARRDTREARALLKRQLEDGRAYAELYRTTSFMDLAR